MLIYDSNNVNVSFYYSIYKKNMVLPWWMCKKTLYYQGKCPKNMVLLRIIFKNIALPW